MSRSETAPELIVKLAKLLVGHPDKLKHRCLPFGNVMTVFLQAADTDTGRLIGPGGIISRSLNVILSETALCQCEVITEEPTEKAKLVRQKVWNGVEAENIMRDILASLFNNDFSMTWDDQRSADLVTVNVGRGFDEMRMKIIADHLEVLWRAIGRAHNRNIRIWMAEKRTEQGK